MNILITGVTGFVGSHLVEFLLKNVPEANIYGLLRWRSPLDNIKHIIKNVNLVYGDLTDIQSIHECIKRSKPDYIAHLAAQSYVPYSFTCPSATIDTNCHGTCNLFEAIKDQRGVIDPVVLACSSSEVYGQVEANEIPIKETNPFRPASPYAVSKVCEDMLGWQYFTSWNMKIMRSRLFSHTGPRRGSVFAESSFAKQIAEIEADTQEPVVHVGNLDSIRTFMDVRDAVRAYWLLVNKCKPGEVYNIGGSETMSVGDMLNKLISMSTVKNIRIEVDPSRLRPSDVTLQIPDCSKFKSITNWEPNIKFDETLHDLLNFWRSHL